MVTQRQPVEVPLQADQPVYDDPQPIRLPADWKLTDERFLEIGELNPEQFFERTADGRLQQMTWPGALSADVTAKLIAFVTFWAMSSSGAARPEGGGYFLSDELAMAPDVSWVDAQQLAEHGEFRGQMKFAPRFVAEVLSPSQTVRGQQDKMRRWMDNGVRLGWLVDPYEEQVWIYRADGSVEQLDRPDRLLGEDVCVGLEIDMNQVWEAR